MIVQIHANISENIGKLYSSPDSCIACKRIISSYRWFWNGCSIFQLRSFHISLSSISIYLTWSEFTRCWTPGVLYLFSIIVSIIVTVTHIRMSAIDKLIFIWETIIVAIFEYFLSVEWYNETFFFDIEDTVVYFFEFSSWQWTVDIEFISLKWNFGEESYGYFWICQWSITVECIWYRKTSRKYLINHEFFLECKVRHHTFFFSVFELDCFFEILCENTGETIVRIYVDSYWCDISSRDEDSIELNRVNIGDSLNWLFVESKCCVRYIERMSKNRYYIL